MPRPRLDANLKWLFTEEPFLDRIGAAARAGFTGVEYADAFAADTGEQRRRLEDHGLTLVLVNTGVGPDADGGRGLAGLPHAAAAFREDYARTLERAHALGARHVHVMAGANATGPDGDTGAPMDAVAVAHTLRENLAWAAERAAGSGVLPLVEAQNAHDAPGYLLPRVADAARLVRDVGPDRVGLLLDTYHVHRSGDVIADAVRDHAALVRHVQVADAPRRAEPGTGDIDHHALFAALEAVGYDGWIGAEYAPLTSTTEGLGWRAAHGWPDPTDPTNTEDTRR